MSGALYIAAGVALVELWRRGYLSKIVAGFTSAATSPIAYDARRRFTLPGAGASGGGSGATLSA